LAFQRPWIAAKQRIHRFLEESGDSASAVITRTSLSPPAKSPELVLSLLPNRAPKGIIEEERHEDLGIFLVLHVLRRSSLWLRHASLDCSFTTKLAPCSMLHAPCFCAFNCGEPSRQPVFLLQANKTATALRLTSWACSSSLPGGPWSTASFSTVRTGTRLRSLPLRTHALGQPTHTPARAAARPLFSRSTAVLPAARTKPPCGTEGVCCFWPSSSCRAFTPLHHVCPLQAALQRTSRSTDHSTRLRKTSSTFTTRNGARSPDPAHRQLLSLNSPVALACS
jgi:hypothetical protein